MLGKKYRFLCQNITGCEYARRDHVYLHADSDRSYQCSGSSNDGCGQQLVAAGTINHAPVYFLAATIILGLLGLIGFKVYQYHNPTPLTGYKFASKTSEIEERGTIVSIQVIRSPEAKEARILYKTVDRTALAGQDYLGVQGVLEFSKNEFENTIEVTILPDNQHGESVEEFLVVLTNTLHDQQHVIFINEPLGNAESINSAQTLVRNLSGVAMDVAAYGKRVTTIFDLLQSGAIQDEALFLEYHKMQEINESNLRKARERYLEIFRDLITIPATFVDAAFEQWLTNLRRQEYDQQHSATILANTHFQNFSSDGIASMDIWSVELQQVIPDLDLVFDVDSSSGI